MEPTSGASAPEITHVEVEESPHLKGLGLTFDQVDKLLHKYVPSSGGCRTAQRIKLGFNNMSFAITANSGEQYVLRATKDTWPAQKVESEMACINLMHDLTTLPIPTPICYDSSASEFGCRWILMERMPGRVVDAEEFDSLPEQVQHSLLSQMVGFLGELQQLKFDKTGSFRSTSRTLKGREAVELQPYFDGQHGPFSSSQEFAVGMLQYAITQAESKAALSELMEFALRAKGLVAKLSEKSIELPDIPIVAFHGDFAFRNMLFEGEGNDMRVTAMLDWEWGGAKPVHCEWMDCSFGDRNVARSAAFQAECIRKGVQCPETIPGFATYSALAELGEALNPWVVGCFSPDKDAEAIAESKCTCDRLLQSFQC
mmetsp:Transcript_62127/g.115259  ORF Transcript_62127/g.115259 Transcript_62127/m.115259 type:complete len:371 (-) Transcript_62127:258-1370(-)